MSDSFERLNKLISLSIKKHPDKKIELKQLLSQYREEWLYLEESKREVNKIAFKMFKEIVGWETDV